MEAKNPLGGNFLFVIKCLFIEDFHPHTAASDCVWDDRAGDGKDMGANPGCLRMKMSLGKPSFVKKRFFVTPPPRPPFMKFLFHE